MCAVCGSTPGGRLFGQFLGRLFGFGCSGIGGGVGLENERELFPDADVRSGGEHDALAAVKFFSVDPCGFGSVDEQEDIGTELGHEGDVFRRDVFAAGTDVGGLRASDFRSGAVDGKDASGKFAGDEADSVFRRHIVHVGLLRTGEHRLPSS